MKLKENPTPYMGEVRTKVRLFNNADANAAAEGKLAAVWTIDHVRRTNPGGVGGGVQLGILQNMSGKLPVATLMAGGDIDEHLQRVASAEAVLVAEIRGDTPEAPPPPSPNVAASTVTTSSSESKTSRPSPS